MSKYRLRIIVVGIILATIVLMATFLLANMPAQSQSGSVTVEHHHRNVIAHVEHGSSTVRSP
jgi:hypothetical protein